MKQFFVLTLFPEMIQQTLSHSIMGRAQKEGHISVEAINIRDYTLNKQKHVDDYPYGGGAGMVMQAQPIYDAYQSIAEKAKGARVVYMTPQGRPFTQRIAEELSKEENLVFLCGHYEGIDERIIEEIVTDEISLGDFVLTGGELAAITIIDAVSRLVPGVLGKEDSFADESFSDGLLEYPQYTRPALWEGRRVPEVLINGDHEKVDKWRRKQQLQRTMEKRPDMFSRLELSDEEDLALLRQIKKEAGRMKLTEEVTCRPAAAGDIPVIMDMVAEAKKSLGRFHVDQWQGDYPGENIFRDDISRGECFLLLHGDEPAAFFVLSVMPEPCYDEIKDGKWTAEMPACVLHRSAVAGKYRGSGMAERLMLFVERQARAFGLRCIRTDTHKKNKPMQNLLRQSGYRYRGNVEIDGEPGHDSARQAFEKILKNRCGEK